MKIYAKTDIGLLRPNNEDAYVFIEKDDQNCLAFVCDGMGGHLGGSYAANQTIDILSSAYHEQEIGKNVNLWLYDKIQKANEFVYNESLKNPSLKGMGTTLSGILQLQGKFYYAHLGDSRVYIYDDAHLEQITTDHTLVNELLHGGFITYKQSLKHPKKHVLTNALGIKKEVSVDIGEIKKEPQENIFICSDGLYNMLDNKKIEKILSSQQSITEKGNELLQKALQAGGTDNITFIILECDKS